MERLGIVSVGNIGKILLKKLVEAGYVVSVYRHRQDQNAKDEVIKMGGLPVSSAKEIVKDLMLYSYVYRLQPKLKLYSEKTVC